MSVTATIESSGMLSATPVSASERIALLDVLRACALFGILLANFTGGSAAVLPGANEFVNDQILIRLVYDSARPLFGFLFGLGFAVQLLRAHDRRTPVFAPYLRRLLVLFLIGTAHYLLIWSGDILVLYALTGFFLLPLYRLSPGWIGLLIIVVLAWNMEFQAGGSTAQRQDAPERIQVAEMLQAVGSEEVTVSRGMEGRLGDGGASVAVGRTPDAYGAEVRSRWIGYARMIVNWTEPLIFLMGDVLPAFLIGLFVGRKRWLHEPEKHRRGLVSAAAISLPVAIAANLYSDLGLEWGGRVDYLQYIGANGVLTVFYVSTFALLFLRGGLFRRAALRLQPAGRMALTNYISQSVVMTLVFFAPYGFGLTDPGTALMILIHACLFFLIQVPFSRWWLARYRYGPLEWVWRSLTYWTFQPMRIGVPAPVLPQPAAAAVGG